MASQAEGVTAASLLSGWLLLSVAAGCTSRPCRPTLGTWTRSWPGGEGGASTHGRTGLWLAGWAWMAHLIHLVRARHACSQGSPFSVAWLSGRGAAQANLGHLRQAMLDFEEALRVRERNKNKKEEEEEDSRQEEAGREGRKKRKGR